MKHFFFFLFTVLGTALLANGDGPKGHDIKLKLSNYSEKTVVLGFYYGEKTYVKDTAKIDNEGYFTFRADTLLPCGMYLFVLQPDNNFIQFALDDKSQQCTITCDAKNPVETWKSKGNKDLEEFYSYMRYLSSVRPEADSLRADLNRKKGNPADSIAITQKLDALDKRVREFQLKTVTNNRGNMVGKIIAASIDPEIPEMKGPADSIPIWQYYWAREHYFDNIDLADPCMLRGPVLHQKVDHYINKLVPQHPDSICLAIDQIMDRVKGSQEVFKYFAIHFLNYYAKSQIVGFDAVYVHVGRKYYCSGKADWTSKEDLEKICENVDRLEPILIGKVAPNIVVKKQDNTPIALYDVDADYTVLFFWATDCSHCKKAAPSIVEFYKKFKDRGVKMFNVCTAVTDKAPECWQQIEEKGFQDMINTYDPYIQSRYKTLYDVRTTPQIFILNRKHVILMKRIAAEQLIEVMEQVIKVEDAKLRK